MRDHQSHDVLLMCMECHQSSNLADLALRRELAKGCSAPIGIEEDVKSREDFGLKQVRSAARALIKDRSRIPESRARELEKILEDHFEVEVVDEEILKRGSKLDPT